MAYRLNKNQSQLLKLLGEVKLEHRTDPKILQNEYEGLMRKIDMRRKISLNKRFIKCRHCNESHRLYFCNMHNCTICGIRGHEKQICDTPIYYINLMYLCGCNGRRCKQIRSELNKNGNLIARNSTHCCYCKNPTPLESMMMMTDRRLKCEHCINSDKVQDRKEAIGITTKITPSNKITKTRNS